MVKTDVTRDYYGDLEVPPTADETEIKKQFRRLALKYHPDRNPGKEVEFNSKFQAIQSAQEVLCDPLQRSKYDADRIRAGQYKTYTSPVRPDFPRRDPNCDFPPPPRRTAAPNTSNPNTVPKPPTTGAGRYARYTRKDQTPWPGTDDAQPSPNPPPNAYKTWEQMKSSSSTRERAVPPRPRPSAFQASRNTSNDIPRNNQKDVPKSTQKSRWEWPDPPSGVPPGMSRSNTTRVPKKSGFAPATPGGDEPMARNTSAYFSAPRSGRPQAPRAETQYPPPPPGPPPMAKHPEPPTLDPFKSFRSPQTADDPFAHSDRLSTPYASMSGERTYFSSEGLNRSPSNRSNTGSGGLSGRFPSHVNSPLSPRMHGRHRSASPNYRSPMPQQPNSSGSKYRSPRPQHLDSSGESSSDSSEDEAAATGRRASAGHRTVPREPPIPPRDRYKPATLSGETDGLNDTPATHFSSQSGSHNSNANAETSPEGFLQHRMKREAEKATHPASPLHTNAPWSNTASQRPLEKSKSWHDRYGWTEDLKSQRKFDSPTNGESKENHTISDAGNHSAPAHPLRHPSSENINTNFSPSDWHGKFGDAEEFLGATGSDYTSGRASPPKGRASPPKGRASPPKGRVSPSKGRFRHPPSGYPKAPVPNGQAVGDGNPQMPPPPNPSAQVPSPGKTSFSGEEWSQHFKESNWAYPPPPPPQSPRPGNQKRGKPLRKQSVTQQKRPVIPKPAAVTATIIDDKEELEDTNTALETERSSSSGNGSAMDIDPDPIAPSNHDEQQGSRRQSAVGAEHVSSPQPAHTSLPNNANETPNVDAGAHLDFNDLKNTAPLAPSKSGLKDLDDLSNTLPFESRPSNRPAKPLAPQRLALPNPPKAPAVPDPVTHDSWDYYLTFMKAYMAEWNIFNRKMLSHFQTRQQRNETELGENWIGAIGEDGYARYVQGIEEDIRVREHWNVSCEKHRACMKDMGAVRQKVIAGKLESIGMLAERNAALP